MSKLTKLLEYSVAGNSKRRSLMDKDSFINSFNEHEKQLLISETGETDLVIREIHKAIVVGSQSRQSVRKALPIINTVSNTGRLVCGQSPSGQYADFVAEGSSIPIDVTNYTANNVEIKKAAIRPAITNELIDDCNFDIIELELQKAGAKLENKLNQEAITVMLNRVSGPSDVDPGGTNIGIADIGTAKGKVDDFGWIADSVLIQPVSFGYMIDETNIVDVATTNNKVMGLNLQILDAIPDSTSGRYWDSTDATNHYGALVFDHYNFAAICMREDINTTTIKDPIHDLTNVIAKMRFGVGILNSGAACRILTK
jgi:hypothetical protein